MYGSQNLDKRSTITIADSDLLGRHYEYRKHDSVEFLSW